jgi:integrase
VGGKHTVAEVLDLWVEQNTATWAPSTCRDQSSRVALVKADPIAGMTLLRLSAVDVDRWHARLRNAGVGEGSLSNQHLVLRASVTQAMRWGWVPTNVVAQAQLGRRNQVPRGAMSDKEVHRLLVAAARLDDPGAAVALRLAAVTGARRSELAALRWADLDEPGRLTIDSSLAVIRHGTKEERVKPTLRDDPTKTANRRTIALDPTTLLNLRELQRVREPFGPWMLAVGDRPISPDRIGAWWRIVRDRAGVDGKWRLHDLRLWAATTAISQGHDIRTVANRLGHANPAMTLRTYAHAVSAPDDAVAEALGNVLDSMGSAS